eukprot:13065330-Alexandrium_andersonii.AAC.1
MSASLVGSEMCIRDSPTGAHSFGPCPGSHPACLEHGWGHRAQAPRTWSPVSYTHLTLPTICSV